MTPSEPETPTEPGPSRPRRAQPCPFCDLPFTAIHDLEQHLRSAHRVEPDRLRLPTRRVLGPRVVAELVALVVIVVLAVGVLVFQDAVDSALPHLREPLLLFAGALCLGLGYHLYFHRTP